MRLNWEDQADLLFDQLEFLVGARISNAEYCLRSPAVITNNDTYLGKLAGLHDALNDIRLMRRTWVG